MRGAVFHLSLPVSDLAATTTFYRSVLGAVQGRTSSGWADLILFGHQLTFHQRPGEVMDPDANGAMHFGALLPWDEWEALCAAVNASQVPLLVPRTIFDEGTPAEHGKMLLRDPDGYLLEFKAYRDIATVVPGNRPDRSSRPSSHGDA